MTKIELVVARYNESMDWLLEEDFRLAENVIIYNKGPTEVVFTPRRRHQSVTFNYSVVPLENLGRESHTFLFHIIENYNKLSDITIFLPGSCMSETKESKTKRVLEKVKETNNSVIFGKWYKDVRNDARLKNFTIAEWSGTTAANVSLLPDKGCGPSKIARPFSSWYDHFFGSLKINAISYTSIFAISKEHILQHPIAYYQQLLESVSHHSNPEDGHFMERTWVAVFHPLPESCLYIDRPHSDSFQSKDHEKKRSLSESATEGKEMIGSLLQSYSARLKKRKG